MANGLFPIPTGTPSLVAKRCAIWLILVTLALTISARPASTATNRIIVKGADDVATHTYAPAEEEGCPPFDHSPGFIIQSANANCYQSMKHIAYDLDILIDQVPYRVILVRADDNTEMRMRYPEGLFEENTAAEAESYVASAELPPTAGVQAPAGSGGKAAVIIGSTGSELGGGVTGQNARARTQSDGVRRSFLPLVFKP